MLKIKSKGREFNTWELYWFTECGLVHTLQLWDFHYDAWENILNFYTLHFCTKDFTSCIILASSGLQTVLSSLSRLTQNFTLFFHSISLYKLLVENFYTRCFESLHEQEQETYL